MENGAVVEADEECVDGGSRMILKWGVDWAAWTTEKSQRIKKGGRYLGIQGHLYSTFVS